jgi:hypothetical protein
MLAVLKGIGAVLVGLTTGMVVVMVLTYLAALILFEGDLTAPPTQPYLVLNIAYSFSAATLAGWLAARLAGSKPLVHAAGVAALILVLSSGGGSSPGVGVPEWYGLALTVLMPVGALFGGWLRARSANERAPA